MLSKKSENPWAPAAAEPGLSRAAPAEVEAHVLEHPAAARVLAVLPVGSELVVELALLRVLEHRRRLARLLEALLGLGLVRVQVRVVLAGQFLERLGDVVLAGIAPHPEHW
jgi:hypothetical protein